MVVSEEIAERLAEEAAERGTSPEDVAAELLGRLVPPSEAFGGNRASPSWVGAIHSGRSDLSERHEEIIRGELGRAG